MVVDTTTALTRAESVVLSDIVFPEHANHYGTMFGGHAFATMDKAAFLAANRYARSLVVTASSESVDFTVPIRVGMILETVARVIHVRTTSMVVRVTLSCREPLATEEQQATTGYFTMVAVDERGRPVTVPQLLVEDRDEWNHAERIREAARIRRSRSET